MNITYRSQVLVEDLAVDECTIHASEGGAWNLWFRVARETDGVIEDYMVAVNPGGEFAENGPAGRRTWGLKQTNPSTWQVSPSINVLVDSRDIHPGEHPTSASAWHQTPAIVNVTAGEKWMP